MVTFFLNHYILSAMSQRTLFSVSSFYLFLPTFISFAVDRFSNCLSSFTLLFLDLIFVFAKNINCSKRVSGILQCQDKDVQGSAQRCFRPSLLFLQTSKSLCLNFNTHQYWNLTHVPIIPQVPNVTKFWIYWKWKRDNLLWFSKLSLQSCALSRDRTGTGLTPLVFETNASTNSAIRAMMRLETQVQS